MAIRTSVEVEGGVLVVRQVADAVDADELRRAGERLGRASHPGVVPVLRAAAIDGGWEVVTGHGGVPLDAARVRTSAHLAAIGAQVATTLADLHDRGVVHGRLERRSVLVGAGGGVLGGLGPDGGGATAEDDVRALVAVLSSLASEVDGGDVVQAVLERIARPGAVAPTARRVASELAAVRVAPGEAGERRPRRLALVGLCGGLAVAVVVAVLGSGGGAAPPDPIVGAGSSTSSTSPSRASGAAAPCVATDGHEVVEEVCGFVATVTGSMVVVDGVRSVVGVAGDVVAVGDWDCADEAAPVLLRPATGEVLVFGPPDDGGARTVVLATRVRGATVLSPEPLGVRCAALAVLDASGARHVIGR